MFENNFNFNNEKESISDELRNLLVDTNIHSCTEDFDYLTEWKNNLLALSGVN